jgi:hypothetical protein
MAAEKAIRIQHLMLGVVIICLVKAVSRAGAGRNSLNTFAAFADYVRLNRITFATSALIVGLMVLPTMAYPVITGDDWLFMFDPRGRLQWYYAIGRIGHDYVRGTLAPILSPHYALALYTGGLFACAAVLAFLFRVSKASHIVLFILLFVMFPLHIENMYYRDNHAPLAVAFVAAGAYLLILFETDKIGPKRVATLAALLLAVALIHQSVVIFIGAAVLAVWLVRLLDGGVDVRAQIRAALWSALLLPLYFPIVAWHKTLVEPWPIPREYSLLGSLNRTPAEFLASLQVVAAYLNQFLFHEQHLIPLAVKAFILAMVAVVTVDAIKTRGRNAALPLALLAALIVAPFGLGLIRAVSWTTFKYTAIALPAAVIYPTIFFLYVRGVRHHALHAAGLVASGLIVLFFFQSLSTVAFATKMTSDRDRAISIRLLRDIEAAVRDSALDTSKEHAILIDGDFMAPVADENTPFNGLMSSRPMVTSSPLCGVYSCDVTKISEALRVIDWDYQGKRQYHHIIQQYEWLFRNFGPVEHPEDVFKTMRGWPHKDAIRVVGQTVLVKVGGDH